MFATADMPVKFPCWDVLGGVSGGACPPDKQRQSNPLLKSRLPQAIYVLVRRFPHALPFKAKTTIAVDKNCSGWLSQPISARVSKQAICQGGLKIAKCNERFEIYLKIFEAPEWQMACEALGED